MIRWPRPAPAPKQTTASSGARAEQMAEAYLRQQGLKSIDRNVSCKQGELDLIMEEDQTLVFVEVRFRKSAHFGSAAETVTASKQRKLIATAQYYLMQHKKFGSRPMRFDVLGIMPGTTGEYEYTWLKNAFDALA